MMIQANSFYDLPPFFEESFLVDDLFLMQFYNNFVV